MQNWHVAGRILVAGPNGGQTWVFSQGVTFSIDVHGQALDTSNHAMVVDDLTECGSGNRSSNVSGPTDNAVLLQGGPHTNKILGITSDETGRGTRIDFQSTNLRSPLHFDSVEGRRNSVNGTIWVQDVVKHTLQ